MNQINLILRSNLSKLGVTLNADQDIAVQGAMTDYAVMAVNRYIDKKAKEARLEAVGFFSSIMKGEFHLYVRKLFFQRAKRQAILRCETENHKVYVIRSGDYSYEVLSTRDVNFNRKVRLLGKNADAKKLTEIADFIAYPKR